MIDARGQYDDPNSRPGQLFRRRFRVTKAIFKKIVDQANTHSDFARWHDGKTDVFGRPCTPLSLLILGALRILGRGVSFDDVAEYIGVSEAVVAAFFYIFVRHWSTVQYALFVRMPMTEEELRTCEREYAMGGLNGCIGSADVCHVAWNCCRVSLFNSAKGKEGFPTLAFQVIVNHRRRILHSTDGFLGSINDKTIASHDEMMMAMRTGSHAARSFKFSLFDAHGTAHDHTGAWLLVDNGYHKWSILMNPIWSPSRAAQKEWSANVESFRKDVECTFGILKGRWQILKVGLRMHDPAVISQVWKTCCALHNMLLTVRCQYCGWVDGELEPRESDSNSSIVTAHVMCLCLYSGHYHNTHPITSTVRFASPP